MKATVTLFAAGLVNPAVAANYLAICMIT